VFKDGLWEFLDPDTVVRLISDHDYGMQTLGRYEPGAADQTLADVIVHIFLKGDPIKGFSSRF